MPESARDDIIFAGEPMTVASNNHILIDDAGVARIDGTRLKVVHLVKEMLQRKASPDQLRETFPHLSLAQIHAALAYYYDHQSQLEAQSRDESAEFDSASANAEPTPGREKLRNPEQRP
jgi:uncharacterized protein (DUF433 family)